MKDFNFATPMKNQSDETAMDYKSVKNFMIHNFRHFNAATVVDASRAYVEHLAKGGKMMITIAGAMSTGELGVILAEMIRNDKVHAISCTGANLEEDIYNLIAHNHYERIPHYRSLTTEDEVTLLKRKLNRVTDTCIPEEEALRKLERIIIPKWIEAEKMSKRFFPHEFIYQIIRDGSLKPYYQIDPKDSWVVAACEKDIPLFVPGWEDSTTGNVLVACVKQGKLKDYSIIKSGLEAMDMLVDWYRENSRDSSIGFFQIGGGIAGDFPICVVPLIRQDLKEKSCKQWGYFCQISDSTTSYGSYSGAVPNEKITWEKLPPDAPKFIIESDASIVAPLIFAYVLAE